MGKESSTESFDVDNILASLEEDRESGALPNIVTESTVRYGVDPDDPESLVAVDSEGKRVLLPGS
ncbi:hypothetical protein [Halomonas rhizosphaerae]|uniref:Halobacterial output domain-containing protein n=1 Tax=Halomonas rhizosphaerae TaxID=3043296 RepID=A0ABT6V4C0_9GAMM|nr:hypothetical protein [Halomonas rhizosphaerae]MDI5891787.1 hypothetical protein [Halomonas rhizosphaerae]